MVIEEFEAKIDLRSSFIEGFDFDRSTAKWWSEQSKEAKAALLSTNDNRLCTVEDAVKNLCQWITDVKEENKAENYQLTKPKRVSKQNTDQPTQIPPLALSLYYLKSRQYTKKAPRPFS